MKAVFVLGVALSLAACGANSALKPAKGKPLPVAPYGATVAPTPAELLKPSNQARPARSDELLTTSQTRRGDDFTLPPPK